MVLTPQILVNALDAGEAHFSQIALLVSAAGTACMQGVRSIAGIGLRIASTLLLFCTARSPLEGSLQNEPRLQTTAGAG